MNKSIILLIVIILSSIIVLAENTEEEAIEKAKEMKADIIAQCQEDPYECTCENIPCDDILDAENERKEEAYERCNEEKKSCEKQLTDAREEMQKQKEEIETKCKADLNDCNCDIVKSEQGKEDCELAVLKAKKQANEERNKFIEECSNNIDTCNCDSIQNIQGKEECTTKLKEATELRTKIEEACKTDLGACNCNDITNEVGKTECEKKRKEAMTKAGSKVTSALIKCFKDVNKCDCNNLDLNKQEYIDFCEVQKSYGIGCRDEGLYCEKLEDISYVPYGLPSFLEPIFKKTYQDLIKKEKEQGAKKAAEVMRNCILDPNTCDCTKVPTYAVDFCENKKQLQLKCYNDNYEACMTLESEPNLPANMPKFVISLFEGIAEGARKTKEGTAKANAAKKVGDMILECMDDETKCNCDMAPKGTWKAFCEHKKELIKACNNKIYHACLTLDEEPIYTEDMPTFIKDHLKKNVVPNVEEKKITIYNRMKINTICENTNTLKECKVLFESG